MMLPITLVVLGDPKGQPRPKAFCRGGRASVYDPGTAEGWKSQIAVAAKEQGVAGLMLDMPLRVDITCYFRRPKSHYRTGKNSHILRENAPKWNASKPDRDNLDKAICDALTNLGVWRDDAQVVDGHAPRKRFSDGAPRTLIIISLPHEQ